MQQQAKAAITPGAIPNGRPSVTPNVTVIIPCWRRADLLRLCLASLAAQSEQRFCVVLVSNGGGAPVEAVAREFATQFDCRLIGWPENRGFAAGVNAGLDIAQTEYVAVINDDVRLHPDWLRTLTGWLDTHPETGLCVGTILSGDGERVDNLGDAVTRSGAAMRLGSAWPAVAERDESPRPLLAASWTALVLRRSVIETVGKLDEKFISYLEDIDYAVRCVRGGVSGTFVPTALCWHCGGASSGSADSSFVFRQMTRNQRLLWTKVMPAQVRLANRRAHLVAGCLWLAMAIRKGRFGAWLAGQLSYIQIWPKAKRMRLHWDEAATARLQQWLETGEAAIYADQFSAQRSVPDAYWRWYFALVGKPAAASDSLLPPGR